MFLSRKMRKKENFVANIGENEIYNTKIEKAFVVTFNNRLTFNIHIFNLCKTANNKHHALTRVSSYIDQDKKRIIFNSNFSSRSNYCSFIWINYRRSPNIKINKLIERVLKLIYSDQTSTFQELRNEDNSIMVHQKV